MWLAVVLVAVVGLTSSGLVGVAAAQDTAPTCSNVSFSGGDGSADDPYEIENVSQLQCIEEDLDAHYELVSDVDASATSGWNDEKGFEPIGSCTEVGEADPWEECSGQQFTGTFDGNSHTVSGLTIDRPDTNGVGLFAAADEARFTNLRLASVNITGGENTGGLAGQLVSDKINTKDGFVGNVSVNGTVTGELDTAGVVGHGYDITLEDQIVFTGTVVGSDEVGGILGRSSKATAVSTSYVRATVEADRARGRVHGDNADAGGLVGNSGNPSTFTNVYTVGSVSGEVAGSIVGDGKEDTFEDVYWDTDRGPNDAVGGYTADGVTQLSTAEMQGVTAEEHMDFDWDGTWQSVANDYPVFQWEAAAVGESSIAGIDATDATAVVNETGGVTVVATDEFGNRLESTSISVDATDGLSGINTGDTETTDSNGQATFTFTEETAGTYNLTFSADESITDTATVTIREGVNCAVVEYSGDGSTDDPYEIDSLAKLQCIKQDLDAHYELVSDVNASATSGWNDEKGFEPIGNFSQPFTGTFDGNANSIEGLAIDRPNDNFVGLFGAAVGTTDSRPLIGNLRLEGVNITGQAGSHRYDGTGGGGVAGLLGGVNAETNTSHARIVNVSVNGTITASGGDYNVAGIVAGAVDFEGRSNGFLLEDQAVFTGEIDAPGVTQVGGMVSRTGYETSLSTGYVVADITAGSEVGGIVGHSSTKPSTFEEMYYAGNISGDSDVGAIVGLVGDDGDDFQSSVYWDSSLESDGFGVRDEDGTVDMTPLSTAEMQGVTAEENMDFDWDGTWQSVASDYPVFQWEAAAVDGTSVANIEAVPVALASESTDTLTVRATDEFGNPIEGVEITVQDADGLSFDNETNSTETNGETTFTVETGAEAAYSPTFTAVDRSITDTATMITYAEGNGSESDPYGIGNWYHLDNVRENPAANYTLIADLDSNTTGYDEVANASANDEMGFEPIGSAAEPFTGSFDGNESTISGVIINRPQTDEIGLFGHVGADGEVRNATLEAAEVTGGDEVGVVVGDSAGSVTNVMASGNVTGDEYVGGVVGYADSGVISDSHGSVTVNATNSVGGLVGQGDNAAIRESVATGSVNASGSWAGGLVGDIYGDSSIKNSMASGNVTGDQYVGGLVGYSKGDVTNATAAGTVSGSDNDVGGLIGYTASGELANVIAFGDVSGEAYDVGGLVGDNSVTVTNATASGNVSGEDDEIGGLIGDNSGSVTNVTASGTVTGDDEVGGLIGDDDASVVWNATASGNVTGDTEVGGLIGVSSGSVIEVTASGSVTGTTDVGGLIGDSSESVVQNATASGNVTGDEEAVGGLIGDVDEGGKILNSYATGDVSSSASWAVVGGLVGDSSGERIADSFATGNVTADGSNVGGLVGIHRRGNITNVSSSGAVSGTSNVGGLVGKVVYNPDRVIRNASATGDVTASGINIGGFVGLSESESGTVIDSVARGDVNVTEEFYDSYYEARAGGFIGKNQFATLTNVSASGDVYIPDADFVGGLIGENKGNSITDAIARGNVTGDKKVGGLIGENNGESLTDAIARGNVSGEGDVGGLIGRDVGRSELIVNATATGQVTATGDDVGGLIGFSARPKTLENIRATGHVTGDKEVGGLVGDVRSGIELINATASGDVKGTQYVGGLAGELYQPTITDATATGDVTSTATAGSSYAGGLIGEMPAGTISASAATGNVTAAGSHAGGLVGLVQDTEFVDDPARINESYATGDVTGNQSVGGLAGKAIRTNITNTYATGSVDGNASLGGLVGNVSGGNVTFSYAVGAVADEPAVGGLIGTVHNSPTVQNSYWDNQTTERTSSAGAGAQSLRTVELKGDTAKTNATGFDFQHTWDVVDNETHSSYPYLRNNTQSPPPGLHEFAPKPGSGGDGNDDRNSGRGDSDQSSEDSNDSDDNSGNGASTSGGSGSDDGDDDRSTVSVRSMAQPDAAGEQDGESDVAPTSTTGFVVSMRNVDGGEQIAVDFTEQRRPTATQPTDEDVPSTENEETPSGESAPRNVQSDGLVLTVSEEGDYELTVTARDVDVFATAAESGDGDAEPSDGEDTDRGEGESSGEVDLSTDAFDEESTRFVEATSARPVGFITVEHTFDSDDLETATHRFRVRKSYLAATGATAESVALYREEPESYRALSTRRVGEDDAYYYFEADTPGFSTFVIGTEAPIFDLGEPSLEQADVETGVIDASIPVENIGTEPGTYTVRLRGDGVVLAETEVSVPAGETVEATVRTTAPDADGLALTVAGESLGEFTVEDSDADGSESTTDAGVQSTADAEDATDEPSDTADGSAPGGRFLVLLVAAVLVVVAVWALRRRDEP